MEEINMGFMAAAWSLLLRAGGFGSKAARNLRMEEPGCFILLQEIPCHDNV